MIKEIGKVKVYRKIDEQDVTPVLIISINIVIKSYRALVYFRIRVYKSIFANSKLIDSTRAMEGNARIKRHLNGS